MHVKNIHSMIEKLSEVAKCELDKGVENIDTKEMGEVAEIIKELSEAEYYAKISKAMDEAEYGEDYDYMGAYDEHERKGYRGQPRSQSGRYMSRGDGRRSNRGRGSRRGYESSMMEYDDMDYEDMERMRDYDRGAGKMYYSSSDSQSDYGTSRGEKMGYSEGRNDGKEGRSGSARRGYIESKEIHKENSSENKQAKMKELENYMKSIAEDLTEAIEGASAEERTMAKSKLSALVQKM